MMEEAGNKTMTADNFLVEDGGIIHSIHLPPSMDDERVLMDWDSELIIHCQKCASNIPFSILNQHNNWHARVNLLFRFRALIRESASCLPFGPTEAGVLLKIDYRHNDKLLETQVGRSDVKNFLSRLSIHPFVTLKFVEGLQYTFGSRYINRVIQGEFVYLSLNDEDSCGRAENYFSLKCSDEGFWIGVVDEVEGRCPSTVVSVNGVVVGGGLPHQKITFGDIVTISNDGDGTNHNVRRFCDLVFKASHSFTQSSEQVPRGRDATEAFVVGAMDNNLIVQNIARQIPNEALKRLRFVSQVWNVECLTQMRDRVVLTVLSNKCEPNDGSNHPMQISTFMQSQLSHLGFPHWRIQLDKLDLSRPRFQFRTTPNGASITPILDLQGKGMIQRKTELEKKLLDDLILLFDLETNTRSVKSLLLSGQVNSATQLKMFATVLCGVAAHLTTLELSIHFCQTSTPWDLSIDTMSVLTNLTLTLDGPSPTPSFFAELLSAVQNIQTLILNNPVKGTDSKAMTESRNYLFPKNCVETISKLQTEESKFLNLTSISVATCGDYFLQPLCLLPQGRLRKLEMGRLSKETDFRYYGVNFGEIIQLPLALSRHQDTIQELVLYFTAEEHMDMKFPTTMPNLRSLSLFFQLDVVFDRPDVHFNFGHDVPSLFIDYRRRWPSLAKLVVWPVETSRLTLGVAARKVDDVSWRKFTPVIAPFVRTRLGEDGRFVAVSNLQTLDIPFRLKSKYHSVLDNLEVIFPNVSFPLELDAARRGQRYDDDDESSSDNSSSSDEGED